MDWKTLRVDASRLEQDFEALARIGSTGDGGVHRPALTDAHLEARRWFAEQVKSGGFELAIDAAGNHSARLPCAHPQAQTLLLGSHLDSVPYGGRFDGALGVLAALEVLRTVQEAELTLPFHLEAIDFTDEEGTFLGLLGSRALAGLLQTEDLESARGGPERFRECLAYAGLDVHGLAGARRDPATLAGYLEVHIEQGPRLASGQADIGVVTSLVGIGSLEVVFQGRADHAGTTPMPTRLDAGLGAAAFILALHERVAAKHPQAVANVGRVDLEPGAFNIVPGVARLAVEYRSPDAGEMKRMEAVILALSEDCAEEFSLQMSASRHGVVPPTRCSPGIQQAFFKASQRLGLAAVALHSGAGHDTMSLTRVCPAGMIFIPSTGGSHSAREHAEWEDCLNGANVLLQAALGWALEGG